MLNLAHEEHQGIVKTKNRLRTEVWWPKIDKEAEELCKKCHECQVTNRISKLEPSLEVDLGKIVP